MEHSALHQDIIGSAMEVHTMLGPGFLESHVISAPCCVNLRFVHISFTDQIDLSGLGVFPHEEQLRFAANAIYGSI
jgi:hypothetical protein